jgi:Ni,Fe-hydrogenase III large subunit
MSGAPAIEGIAFARLAGAVPAWRADVDAAGWRRACAAVADAGGRLGTLWGSEADRSVHAILVADGALLCLRLAAPEGRYPDLSDRFPSAARLQRAVRDLTGLDAGSDRRGWLKHERPYEFVAVEGEGVHEIAVGPVHAGTIEPGHFRFSVVGERVLKLEERLGYTHKGIEKRFEGLPLEEAARLAGRVSGDSTVAFAWAYAMALEAAAGTQVRARALWLRALLLERERIANHLGDLGFLGNDGGLAFGLAQFSRLKEDLLRLNQRLFGHRYAMDRVVPGGVAVDLDPTGAEALLEEADRLERELQLLRAIYYDHAGLQDRCINCGRLAPQTAAALGVVGLAARASGIAIDVRAYPGFAPYPALEPRVCAHRNGDVASRIVVRFEETFESLKLQRRIARGLPAGPLRSAIGAVPERAFGIGWVEGWRGEVLVALELREGRIRRCHAHDPSWQNWPVVEHAVIGNIVPDFPLINKSFNLSYSGHDL